MAINWPCQGGAAGAVEDGRRNNVKNTGRRFVAIVLACASALLTGLVVGAQGVAADPGDIGYEGPSFSGLANPPTADKPQSKLWHVDGVWFAAMYHTPSASWHIFRLDRSTNTWVDTGTPIDDRANTHADALWDGSKLYIASHVVTVSTDSTARSSVSGQPARLYRYSYQPATKTFVLDPGFPTQINNNSSESLVIDKDSTGTLWATWTQVSGNTNTVYVNSTTGPDGTWGTPVALSHTPLAPDDISTLVAYRNEIGVLWSNQRDDTVYWARRPAGSGPATWTIGVAYSGRDYADDHLNIKTLQSDDSGRVFAAIKTSLDDDDDVQIALLTFYPFLGTWAASTFGTGEDCHTRPSVVLDETNGLVHVLATGPSSPGCPFSGAAGTIYMKSAPMTAPVFPEGRGLPIIRDASSAAVNDATTTKQPVNSATGMVVLAVNNSTRRYWHADLSLGGVQVPTAAFTVDKTSGDAPLDVEFTDMSAGFPTSWQWDFGDGATSTQQHPEHVYTTPGTYTVTLQVANSAGVSNVATATITVTGEVAEAPPVAAFTATPLTGPAPLEVSFTDQSTEVPTAWAWDFGDGFTSDVQHPDHTYTTPGTYTVTLRASNEFGESAPVTAQIVVTEPSEEPGPDPTDPDQPDETEEPAPVSSITLVGSTAAVSETEVTAVTLARPAGTAPGHLLLAHITADANPKMNVVPAGWTQLGSHLAIGSKARVFVYAHVVTESSPTSWTWQLSAAKKWGAGMSAFAGVDTSAPFESELSTAIDNTYNSATVTVPGVSASPGAMLVGGVGLDTRVEEVHAPSGWTEAWESTGGQVAEMAFGPAAGGNPIAWTLGGRMGWAAWLIALRPAAAEEPPATTVPETTVPETTVPETTVPETTVPETTVPETTVPETTVPETTVPETTVPETTVPETTVPETTVPEPTESGVTFVGATSAVAENDVVAVTLERPAEAVVGDLLLAHITVDANPKMASEPAGWTLLIPHQAISSKARVFVYAHVVTPDSPASWTWELNSAKKWGAGIAAFRGVDPVTPFDSAVSTRIDSSYGSATLEVPEVVTVTPGALLVGGVGLDTKTLAVDPPAGWTEAWESVGGQVAEMAFGPAPGVGPTGAATWTLGARMGSAGWMVALRPAVP
jgi:PKD repeat protein